MNLKYNKKFLCATLRNSAVIVSIALFLGFAQAQALEISAKEQARIADLIFKNECNRKFECLVSWNDGEDFASLGIGHFIWFPKGSDAPFKESFPDLMRWYQEHHVQIPDGLHDILQPDQDCPWSSKQDFLKPEHQAQIQVLRQFLADTKAVQASFIMRRLEDAQPKMLDGVNNENDKQYIQKQFERVSTSPNGWYALIDYVNFKGEGIKATERYQGKGWGLVQVLLNMSNQDDALASFVTSAKEILALRVKLSPPKRNEQRWLDGWFKRLDTY